MSHLVEAEEPEERAERSSATGSNHGDDEEQDAEAEGDPAPRAELGDVRANSPCCGTVRSCRPCRDAPLIRSPAREHQHDDARC